jgi:vacuolar-type H+-ATPase catalytic subunit A/Vma1
MLRAILRFHRSAQKAIEEGAELGNVLALGVREGIAKMKFLPEEEAGLTEIVAAVDEAFGKLARSRN